MNVRPRTASFALLLVASALSACDSEDLVSQLPDAGLPDAGANACEATYTLFLNRYGGTYSPAGMRSDNSGENRSTLISETATLPYYGAPDGVWDFAVNCVKEELAPFRIEVTETDPGRGVPHMELAVVGAGSEVIGLPEGIDGISPFRCSPIEGISFVFGAEFPQVGAPLCKVMEASVADLFGLDAHFECGSISSYDLFGKCDGVSQSVVDAELECGTGAVHSCDCGGATSNPYQDLAERAGLCSE